MGILKDDTKVTCTMPMEVYKGLKNEDIQLLSIFHSDMYQYYKQNEEWQQVHEQYKEVSDRKKDIEFDIRYKLLKSK